MNVYIFKEIKNENHKKKQVDNASSFLTRVTALHMTLNAKLVKELRHKKKNRFNLLLIYINWSLELAGSEHRITKNESTKK